MKILTSSFYNRWIQIIFLIIAIGSIAYFYFIRSTQTSYQTALVKFDDLQETILSDGVLQAYNKVDVGSQATGQLKKLYVKLGQSVKKGELLGNIDADVAKNDLLGLEAVLAQQLAQLKSKQLDISQAKRELVRQQSMLQSQAASDVDVENSELKLAMLNADEQALNAQIQQSKANINSARTKLNYAKIIAPILGEVVKIVTLEGQTVIAAQQAPTILTLAQLDTMTVKAQVSEAEMPRLQIGQNAYFVTLGDAETKHHGILRRIEPVPEKINNAIFYNVLFDVTNTDRKLWIDMTVQASFIIGEAKHVLTIPASALGERLKANNYYVRLLKPDGTISTQEVVTGLKSISSVEIKQGLSIGDKVITEKEIIDQPAFRKPTNVA